MERADERRELLSETLLRIETEGRLSLTRRPGDEGDWVVVATVPTIQSGVRGVPQLSGPSTRGIHNMQRYASAELAIAGAQELTAARVGGGWVMNLRTGETVRIKR